MYHIVLALILCALCTIIYLSRRPYRGNHHPATRLTTAADIHKLLFPTSTTAQQLRSRALANARLRQAFEINSTFVNGDVAAHSAFAKLASELISLRKLPWERLAGIAVGAVHEYLPGTHASIPFSTFIRRVIMHVVLVGLLTDHADESAVTADDIDFVAEAINELWILSKSSTYRPDLLMEVNDRLGRWLPAYDNPLEIIIPTYETLWRVVAVAVSLGHDNHHAQMVFAALSKKPDTAQYRLFHNDSFSAEAFISEVLRLYPPTRRISRVVPHTTLPIISHFLVHFCTSHSTIAADVEALQRDSVWGNSRGEFDPARHHPQRCTDDQRKTLLAFGAGKLSCVAKNWAPQAAAIIVAAILDQVGPDCAFNLMAGEAVGARKGWDGWVIHGSV